MGNDISYLQQCSSTGFMGVSASIKALQLRLRAKKKIGLKVLTKQVIVLSLTRLTSSAACNCSW